MFSPFLFFEDPATTKARRERERKWAQQICDEKAEPWNPKIKFEQRDYAFEAASYRAWIDQYKLFDVEPSGLHEKRAPAQEAVSPGGTFTYVHRAFPAHTWLDVYQASKQARACFTAPVEIPVLLTGEKLWMSFTPMEVFSLRGGTRRAKGHTVIAGLGLGYQLTEVAKRKQVERITLVERSQELVDWLMPVLAPRLNDKPIDVIIGDARKEVPKLTADVALIDIAASYGGNTFSAGRNIPNVWVWGSCYVS